jgi:hypothetical protein
MGRIGRFISAAGFGFCLICICGPAQAWEMEMGGAFRWVWEVRQQSGGRGFFGQYNVDNGLGTTTANLNFWNGGQFDTNLTTGADAGWSYLNVTLDPTLKLNQAVRLKARLRLAQYGNPAASNYQTQDAPGSSNAFSEGQWTMFWATAQTPWGTLGIGKRPWEFGTGLQYDGSDALTTESMALVVPYGPLEIGLAVYPYRYVGTSGITLFGGPSYYPDPYDLLPQVPRYYSRADRSGTLSTDLLAFVTYASGPMEAGILGSFGRYHMGPEAALGFAGFSGNSGLGQDSEYFHGTAFVRYNNGRFFFNAEGAWVNWTDRYSDPSLSVLPNPRYVEQFRYMAEAGFTSGPAKLSVIYAWSPGPDRRNGSLIGKQSAAFVWHPTFDTHLGNYSLFRPYTYLFAYNHGSGLNAYNLSGNGYIRDAQVLAARLDYAVAANLNLFANAFYAKRTGHGYGWGCIGPDDLLFNGENNDGNLNIVTYPGGPALSTLLNGKPGAPNIPDTDLGYEIDAGFDWHLLENWTVSVLFAYWKPGRWFSFACIDRSVPNWNMPGAVNFGTRPDKVIDAVTGTELALSFQF